MISNRTGLRTDFRRGWPGACGVAALLLAGSAAQARPTATAALGAADLAGFSIEELGQIEVTSVAKRRQAVSEAPAAVYVITNDDVRRSGALSLAEALRMAPNLEVGRIDALDYSLTARGFGGFEAANKLLVLIDGRSVYTTLYSGVDWDQQHILLDDLDRIEVVSGPGGTLWGANAVNGVINVVSRSAFDTQGVLASATAGSLDSDLRLRYGGRLGESAAFRIYATGYRRGDLEESDGRSADDSWKGGQAGFRLDWAGVRDNLVLQGDGQYNKLTAALPGGSDRVKGANILGRWTRQISDDASLEVQAYHARTDRKARLVHDILNVSDIEFKHGFVWGERHQIVWGAGYRVTEDEVTTQFGIDILDPPSRRLTYGNVFIQDEITLRDDLSLTLGVKLEDNSFIKHEFLPNVRLAWRPSSRHMLWGAISRAVRNPSRVERDFSLPGIVTPGVFGSEELVAYEAGYRGRPLDRGSISISFFYNDYDELRSNNLTPPGLRPAFVGNSISGQTYGVEVWGDYAVRDWWRMSAGFSALRKDYETPVDALDISAFESVGVDPDYWIKLRSQMMLRDDLDLDLSLRAYDATPRGVASGYSGAKGYVELNARLAWRVNDKVELSLSGFNLLNDRHAEASESRRHEIPRSAQLGLRWAY